jgi:TolB protein
MVRLVAALILLVYPLAARAQPSPKPVVNDRWPRFSPDGSSIAFSSNRGGGLGIYVMAANGSALRKVAIPPQSQMTFFDPSWLPDGSLLYVGSRPTLASGADNGFEAEEFIKASPTGQDQRILFQGVNVERPSSSPSGDSLVFEAEHGPFSANPDIDIYAFDVESLTLHPLTKVGQNVQAAWSPDGTKIAYACRKEASEDLQICSMNTDGTNVRALSRGGGSHEWPAWSPDSRRIAFFLATNVAGKVDSRIVVINTDGTGQSVITRHEGAQRDETPCWSPDGKRIAFQTDRLGGGFRIALMNPDGSDVTMLTK